MPGCQVPDKNLTCVPWAAAAAWGVRAWRSLTRRVTGHPAAETGTLGTNVGELTTTLPNVYSGPLPNKQNPILNRATLYPAEKKNYISLTVRGGPCPSQPEGPALTFGSAA